jgi:hypothetical protein
MVIDAIGIVQWIEVWLAIWLTATVVLALWEFVRAALLSIRNSDGPLLTNRYARVVYATAFALGTFVLTVLLNQPAPDIVYKAF